MATIQFELERLYDLVKETQEQKDLVVAQLHSTTNTLNSTRVMLEEKLNEVDEIHAKFVISQAYLQDKQGEVDELRTQNEKMREFTQRAEQDNYALNHRFECLKDTYHITYKYLEEVRKENSMLKKQIDDLTDGRIKYKKAVDPDDLEEYVVGPKIYLRDVLTDAIYTRHGKLIGYIHEDTGELVKIK
jgi:predicted nuclease with TOPRIM domain